MSSPAPASGRPAAAGSTLRVAVLGLGEAGSIFAAGIAAGPADVRGFDPADVATPAGVSVADSKRHGRSEGGPSEGGKRDWNRGNGQATVPWKICRPNAASYADDC